jgi:hypothetical protein
MTTYTIETRLILKEEVDNDEHAKMQVATLLMLYKIGVEENQLAISDIEMGLLRDEQPIDLPVPEENVYQMKPRKE